MRVTNQMMTNNMLSHINSNKWNMSKLENQYATGKKILKPSDDPIIAVRALKLRSNLTELTQYVEKNIPDAESWMEVTESSLDNVKSIITEMNKYCVQGAHDTLTADERTSILSNLVQLKDHIYQEGNSQYAGRYVFTGFKTDTPLIYTSKTSFKGDPTKLTVNNTDVTNDTTNQTYVINLGNEKMSEINEVMIGGTKIDEFTKMTSAEFGNIVPDVDKAYILVDTNELVLGANYSDVMTQGASIDGAKFQGYNLTEKLKGSDIEFVSSVIIPEDENKTPYTVQTSRLQLAYNSIYSETVVDKNGVTIQEGSLKSLKCNVNGVNQEIAVTKTINSIDAGAYEVGDDDVVVLADTGEVLLGKNVAKTLKDAKSIEVNYSKNTFESGELRPEHFFDSTYYGVEGQVIKYEQKQQDITYEVNFGQTLKVNTEAKDAIGHEYARLIDDLSYAVSQVTRIEQKISTIQAELKNVHLNDAERQKLTAQLEQQETALVLSKGSMQEAFSKAITTTQAFEDKVNVAVADLGSRSKRLELTKSRLEDQQVELEDLKSNNEDADLVETVIRYKSAEAIYTSALTAAGSVIKTNLLNFL